MKKILLTFLLCLILTSMASGQFFAPHQKPNLGLQVNKAHPLAPTVFWLFNENGGGKVFDLSWNGNTGTFVNSPIWVPGKYGSAIQFVAGDSDYITIGDKDAFSFTTGSADLPFSIVSSFKSTDLTNTNAIISKFTDDSPWNAEWSLFHLSGGGIRAQLMDGASTVRISITSSSTYGTNTQVHVVFTYDGSGSETGLNFYINGVLDSTATKAKDGAYAKMDNLTCSVEIGVHNREGIARHFEGLIDFVDIYSRELSASEIALLYNQPFIFMEPAFNWMLYGAIVTPSGQIIFINY